MPELTRQQKAAITKRNNTRSALMHAASDVFDRRAYRDIPVEDVFRSSGISSATFYEYFSGKSSWAAAVLDIRLGEALDRRSQSGPELRSASRSQLLGHFGLLYEVSAPLSGITQALVEERARGEQYTELLPRYYGEVTQALRDGQEQQAFRDDLETGVLADFALDSLASLYAIHLDERVSRASDMTAMVLDSLVARE